MCKYIINLGFDLAERAGYGAVETIADFIDNLYLSFAVYKQPRAEDTVEGTICKKGRAPRFNSVQTGFTSFSGVVDTLTTLIREKDFEEMDIFISGKTESLLVVSRLMYLLDAVSESAVLRFYVVPSSRVETHPDGMCLNQKSWKSVSNCVDRVLAKPVTPGILTNLDIMLVLADIYIHHELPFMYWYLLKTTPPLKFTEGELARMHGAIEQHVFYKMLCCWFDQEWVNAHIYEIAVFIAHTKSFRLHEDTIGLCTPGRGIFVSLTFSGKSSITNPKLIYDLLALLNLGVSEFSECEAEDFFDTEDSERQLPVEFLLDLVKELFHRGIIVNEDLGFPKALVIVSQFLQDYGLLYELVQDGVSHNKLFAWDHYENDLDLQELKRVFCGEDS